MQTSSQSGARLSSYAGESSKQLATTPQPLVLTPKAVSGGGGAATAAPAVASAAAPGAKSEIETLMLADSVPAATSGFYLQLGAYTRAENAEAVRGKLAGNGLSTLEVVQSGPVHRLFGGPFASRLEALQAAQGLPSSLSLKPIVVQR